MARERIKISKIENPAARQVTFSKRRRGLFKKAQELAILCDVDVGIIVFSSTGKLYNFSSISMEDIIQKYSMNLKDGSYKPGQQSVDKQNAKYEIGGNEMEEVYRQLRHFRGEDIEGLTLNELVQLEKMLEQGLSRVLEKKGEKIMEDVRKLQNKGEKLMKENELLRQKVMEMTKGKEQVASLAPVRISHDGKESPVSVASASNSRNKRDLDDVSDPYLKLGLSFN